MHKIITLCAPTNWLHIFIVSDEIFIPGSLIAAHQPQLIRCEVLTQINMIIGCHNFQRSLQSKIYVDNKHVGLSSDNGNYRIFIIKSYSVLTKILMMSWEIKSEVWVTSLLAYPNPSVGGWLVIGQRLVSTYMYDELHLKWFHLFPTVSVWYQNISLSKWIWTLF